MLTAKRHWACDDLIVVIDPSRPAEDGQVVARYNTKHDEMMRTKISGPKPTLAEIKAAVAQVTS